MADVQNAHPVIEDAIKDNKGIPDECRYMHTRPLNHARPTLGMLPYLCNDFSDANLDGRGDCLSERSTVCGNFAKV